MIEEIKINYRYQKQKELHEETKKYKKIYLDLNFWIWLSNVHFGRNRVPSTVSLYEVIIELVEEEIAICPISPIVFDELLKQAGEPVFMTLVAFIEKMSKNVITVTEQEIVYLEFREIFTSYLVQETRNDIYDLFWTRPIDLFGHQMPNTSHLSSDENQEVGLYKSYLDYAWNQSLTKMVLSSKIGANKLSNDYKKVEAASRLNEGNRVHNHEISSFDGLYENERLGVLDFYKIIAWRAFEDSLRENGVTFTNKVKVFEKMMYKAVEVKCQIPGIIEVMAGIHSLVRYEKREYIDFNDMYDYQHAFYAIPYFDYFFTETKLSNLVNHSRLKLGHKYTCQIQHRIDEALGCLESLSQRDKRYNESLS